MDNIFITYKEALAILAEHTSNFSSETRSLKKCNNAYLDEDLIADRDFPPFDRVTMDGIAILYEEFKAGRRDFKIEATCAAGRPQITLQNSQNCVEVMTGAMVPKNTDTVIRYEDIIIKDKLATITVEGIQHRQSIHFKGVDIPGGTVIVAKGNQLSSAEINIAAAVGKSSLRVKKMPRVIIFSTGDELVPVEEQTQTPSNPEVQYIRHSSYS